MAVDKKPNINFEVVYYVVQNIIIAVQEKEKILVI